MAMMIPNTATFEIIDGKTGNANGQLQDMFVKAMDAQISIIILGNTETTSNSGTGSQAKSKTHSDQQKEILKADLAYLESKLNDPHFIKILQSYDLPVMEDGRFNIKSEIDINYAAQKVIIDTTLSNAGLPIAENYFYETYDIPKPGAGDKVIKIAPPPPQEDSELNMSDQTLALRPGTPLPVIQKLIRKELNDFFA
jgi:phage gp29-like protein